MTDSNLRKKLNFLTFYSIISSLLFLVFLVYITTTKKEKFDELTVKRINVVDESGKSLRMVISNEVRQHPGIINGQKLKPRERPSGMIFFNSIGDECGGLVYDGNDNNAGMVLSLDKFRDDQIMQFQYMENTQNNLRKYGLQLWDYPKENTIRERMQRFEKLDSIDDKIKVQKEYKQMKLDSLLMEKRLFIGKNFNKDVGLFINDKSGSPRIKIYVDNNDMPKIELLDKNGKIIK
ncbi:MAG: hypothetical protein MI739_12485 [Bacteroidales bacterium]|nr:hypothetical protein [Bacteroidales bacterium]